jgi:hypothetical protein
VFGDARPEKRRRLYGSDAFVTTLVTLARRRVRLLRELHERAEEFLRLANEQSHRCKEVHYARGDPLRLGRPDNRASGQLPAKERARFGHDPIGLELPLGRTERHFTLSVTEMVCAVDPDAAFTVTV